MTREQLTEARARAARQNGQPLLTADDAAAWLRETGVCLFTPRPDAVAAPASSFAEAVGGRADARPADLHALTPARQLLVRLCAAGDAVALRLLPHRTGVESDQPDFLATEETFPFVFALRGDREWRRGPRGKSTPLSLEVWKQLAGAPQAASSLQRTLGRHLTEAAVLRALGELWAELRIEPVYVDGGETLWQLLDTRRERAMTAGAAMGQATALSALVSVYLQAAVAATGDEIEAFLSPLASRSRVREAVRGMIATRQLGVRPLGADEHFYVEGSLPEFPELGETAAVAMPDLLPEVEAPADVVIKGEDGGSFRIEALPDGPEQQTGPVGEGRKRYTAARSGPPQRSGPSRSDFSRNDDRRPERRTFGGRPAPRPTGGAPGETRKPFFAREPWKEDRPRTGAPGQPPSRDRNTPYAAGGENDRPPFPKRPPSGDRKPFGTGDRKPFGEGRKPFGTGDRKPFGAGGAKPFRTGKPFSPEGGAPPPKRFGGENRPFENKREGFRPREERGDREGFGARKPFGERGDGERRPFGDARPQPPYKKASFGGERGPKPFPPREDARPFNNERKPFGQRDSRPPFPGRRDEGERPPRGEARPSFPDRSNRQSDRPDRPPYRQDGPPQRGGKPFGGGFKKASPGGGFGPPRPFRPREDGEAGSRPAFRPADRSADRPDSEGGPRRFTPGAGRPARPGERPAGPGGKRPRTAPFTSSGKPRSGVSAPTGRPGPRASRPGGTSGKPGGRPFNAGSARKGPGKGPGAGKGKPPRRDA